MASKTYIFALENSHHLVQEFAKKARQVHFALPYKYHFGAGKGIRDGDENIDIDYQNSPVLHFVESLRGQQELALKVVVVPGFVPPSKEPVQLHPVAKVRLNAAVGELLANPGTILLVSGGNAHPQGTPFNEAMEMKRHLVQFHKVPEFLIAIDANAQNTVTNLRNAGRFVLSLGLEKAKVITTLVQNLYIGLPRYSSFYHRSQKLLGYSVGRVEIQNLQSSLFWPHANVLQKSESEIDP